MTLLGNINIYEEDEEEIKDTKYTYGIYKKEDKNDISLSKCFAFSAILHPVVAGLIWLGIFILTLLGITFSVFEKPQQKPKDIEFVLVNKEGTPINKNTKYRSDRNSRAGGIHDPKRPVSQPQAASQPSKPQQAAPVQKAPQKQQRAQQPAQKQAQQPKKAAPKKQQQSFQMPWAPHRPDLLPVPAPAVSHKESEAEMPAASAPAHSPVRGQPGNTEDT